MADLIYLPRATDENNAIVSDATAFFFAEGTTTPLVVYTDDTLATPRGTSVAADAAGVFPSCYVDLGTGVKVDVRNGAGVSLPGYPIDGNGRFEDNGATTEITGNWTISGIFTYTGNAIFNDGVKLAFGNGGDLEIYHNGVTSIIEEMGAGNLSIRGTNLGMYATGGTEAFIFCTQGGAVDIYHNGVRKLSTTATGIQVIGAVDADSFTGDGFLDEDNMASNSATKVASQQSIKAYVDAQVTGSFNGLAFVGAAVVTDGSASFKVAAEVGGTTTRTGTGAYRFTFATALPNTNYILTGTTTGTLQRSVTAISKTTTRVDFEVRVGGGSPIDESFDIVVQRIT